MKEGLDAISEPFCVCYLLRKENYLSLEAYSKDYFTCYCLVVMSKNSIFVR